MSMNLQEALIVIGFHPVRNFDAVGDFDEDGYEFLRHTSYVDDCLHCRIVFDEQFERDSIIAARTARPYS